MYYNLRTSLHESIVKEEVRGNVLFHRKPVSRTVILYLRRNDPFKNEKTILTVGKKEVKGKKDKYITCTLIIDLSVEYEHSVQHTRIFGCSIPSPVFLLCFLTRKTQTKSQITYKMTIRYNFMTV